MIKIGFPPGIFFDTQVDDLITKEHIYTHFNKIQLQDIVRLGKVDFVKAAKPLEGHVHPDSFEVCYHYKGRQLYTVEGETFETKCGDIFITYPNEVHGSGNHPEEKSSLLYLVFRCMPHTEHFLGLNTADSNFIRDTLCGSSVRILPGREELKPILDTILQVYFSDDVMKDARIHALFVQFFYLLCTIIRDNHCIREKIPPDILSIANSIKENPYQEYLIDELAQRINLSSSQFKRKFKRYMGFSPYDFIVREKIRIAKEMLQYKHTSMTEISVDLGFSSSQHFATVFRKYTGQTPSAYRKSLSGT